MAVIQTDGPDASAEEAPSAAIVEATPDPIPTPEPTPPPAAPAAPPKTAAPSG